MNRLANWLFNHLGDHYVMHFLWHPVRPLQKDSRFCWRRVDQYSVSPLDAPS